MRALRTTGYRGSWPGGWRAALAVVQELRLGVRAFAAHGKPTLAWAESFGEGSGGMTAFVLASAFDEIWLQPGGELGMLGVGIETTFVRGALDRLGIEPQIEQRHEFETTRRTASCAHSSPRPAGRRSTAWPSRSSPTRSP